MRALGNFAVPSLAARASRFAIDTVLENPVGQLADCNDERRVSELAATIRSFKSLAGAKFDLHIHVLSCE
jgi:hypothetical protein